MLANKGLGTGESAEKGIFRKNQPQCLASWPSELIKIEIMQNSSVEIAQNRALAHFQAEFCRIIGHFDLLSEECL